MLHTPSIAQMRSRMNSAHRQLLEAARDGGRVTTPSYSAARGYMTARATLVGWGCIDGDRLTETGEALLRAYQARLASN
ncbi:hypothetical protein [Aquabacterium sp.]|uniref:hypothetical protein n=1 Tax=Aquabacterium sp. TaxID=1872578 RepID=UPI0035B0CBCE